MTQEHKNKGIAIGITVIVSGLFAYWGILGIGVYGMALFVLTPIFLGACPVVIYGRKNAVTRTQARNIGFLSLAVFALGLVAFAMEGIICIAMAAPIGLFLTWIGTIIGYFLIKRSPTQGTTATIILLVAIPATAFIERRIIAWQTSYL